MSETVLPDAAALPDVELRTLGRHLRDVFGRPVHKLSIDGGFTCPNLDGSLARGGCAYCNNHSFSLGLRRRRRPVREQVLAEIERVRASRRTRAEIFLAYFQSFTNTYAPVDELRALYDEALAVNAVVGLDISTRPDCVPDDVVDLLAEYAGRTHLWVELGLESAHEATLRRLNRAHGWDAFADACRRLSGRGIRLCAHLILGLPGEDREMMRETARRLGEALAAFDGPATGVKIHHLHVVKGTALEAEYHRGRVPTLTVDEHVGLACDTLERLPQETVIHRLMGDTLPGTLVAPHWSTPKSQVKVMIERELARRGSRPGSLCGS